ncbi:MAG: helix-turn-helix domain-containing protein [Alphaproteobacteria bacterium]
MPHPVDVHVGARVRFKRKLLGLSQADLGKAVGLTFQQIQKYESGANRVSASRLYQVASILDVPVSFFFEDMPSEITGGKRQASDSPVIDSQTTKFIGAYLAVQDDQVRKRVRDLVKMLARDQERESV